MPTLVLVRHAQAAYSYPDHTRPLTRVGVDQAARLGGVLSREIGAFDVAVCSDATRAQQTFAQIAGYVLARENDRGEVARGVPTATALILTFDGTWENLTPSSCTLRAVLTPPTR